MRILKKVLLGIGVLVGVVIAIGLLSRTDSSLHKKDTVKMAIDAYIYGYPLVTFDMARKQQTNVKIPDAEHSPMGQMIKMRQYLAVDNHCCAAPNADTLYTIAWLDVGKEPWILGIPDMGDRYFIVPLLDGFSEVFKVASPGTTGSHAHTYVITGPGWNGILPEGVTEVKSDTAMVWVLGRIYSTGTPEDYKDVHALQDKFSLVPLSAYGKSYTPPKGIVNPNIDMKTGTRDQINSMDIYTYFDYLAKLLKNNPPRAVDSEMVETLKLIGLIPGEDFDPSKLGISDPDMLKSVPHMAQDLMVDCTGECGKPHFSEGIGSIFLDNFDAEKLGSIDKTLIKMVPKVALLKMGIQLKQTKTTNGWLYYTEGVGNFGTDYTLRGMANLLGPGWNRPQDAIYPISMKDADGNAYDGAKHNYVMRFEKDSLPPVNAFWSLTMYDKDLFFVPNAIDRYAVSNRDTFVTNPDGSIDIYMQSESPGKEKEANWLPAPKGEFKLVIRMYDPKKTPPSILDGSWTPPPVMRVE